MTHCFVLSHICPTLLHGQRLDLLLPRLTFCFRHFKEPVGDRMNGLDGVYRPVFG
jgi:hypothetical protein